MSKVKVALKARSYEVLVSRGILYRLGQMIERYKWGSQIFVVTDPLVNRLYGRLLRSSLPCQMLLVKRGEAAKNLKTLSILYDDLVKGSAHRDALVVALGGGVIGDLAGFLAATYMRGINFVQVPTTLLAQVDAAIGGKTGINHPQGKNLIGAFYQPKLVYIDVETLASLPKRELRTGLVEVVKYGLIDNASFFNFLERNISSLKSVKDLDIWEKIVFESAKIKARIVSKDEREAAYRMVLNLGHTFAHAIEAVTHYVTYNHGEAVAIGLVAASKMSQLLGLMDAAEVNRVSKLLTSLGLPTLVRGLSLAQVAKALQLDKKVRDQRLNFVLPQGLGRVIVRDDVPTEIVQQTLKEIGC